MRKIQDREPGSGLPAQAVSYAKQACSEVRHLIYYFGEKNGVESAESHPGTKPAGS